MGSHEWNSQKRVPVSFVCVALLCMPSAMNNSCFLKLLRPTVLRSFSHCFHLQMFGRFPDSGQFYSLNALEDRNYGSLQVEAEEDLEKEKRTQRFLISMNVAFGMCLLPLMMLRWVWLCDIRDEPVAVGNTMKNVIKMLVRSNFSKCSWNKEYRPFLSWRAQMKSTVIVGVLLVRFLLRPSIN